VDKGRKSRDFHIAFVVGDFSPVRQEQKAHPGRGEKERIVEAMLERFAFAVAAHDPIERKDVAVARAIPPSKCRKPRWV